MTEILMLRQRAGKSRAAVAAELGMSERHLLRLETGHQMLTPRWAHVFASYYGVGIDIVYGGVAA